MGRLPLYEKFKNSRHVDPTGDSSSIGHLRPAMANKCLEHLQTVAKEFGIDGWMDHVDPTLTYIENKDILFQKAHKSYLDSPFKGDRVSARSTMEIKYEYLENHYRREAGLDKDTPNGMTEGKSQTRTVSQKGNVRKEPLSIPEPDKDAADQDGVDGVNDGDRIRRITGDDQGYCSITVPVELANLLERMKVEFGFNSLRAAIEYLIASDGLESLFQEPYGSNWVEWERAIEASIEIDSDQRTQRGVESDSIQATATRVEPPSSDAETLDALKW